jgi:protein-S-isoprenylcysteine O-methyltransferase Ste14
LKNLPPPIWALIILSATYALSLAPGLRDLPAVQNTPLGATLVVLGFILPITAVVQFLTAGTQLSPTSETNNKLVVAGAYQFTRNPMYLGLIVIVLGVAVWVGRPLMYLAPILVFAIANWVHIPFEEAKMRRQFGSDFDAYTKRVRRWV